MSEKRKRRGVVICGAYGLGNAGDEAILKAVLNEVSAFAPGEPVTVLSRNPKETAARRGVKTLHMLNIPGVLMALSGARLYLNGGGSLIQDVTSRRSLWYYLFTLAAARRLGCKVMMYGCGIGPVNSPDSRRLTARVINRDVDAITLRDRDSMNTLRELGVSGPEIVLAADPALTLPPATRETADALLSAAGLHPEDGQRYLGVTVRPWPGLENKAPAFAAAIDRAWEELGLTPVFLPIVGGVDEEAARMVARHLKKAPAAILSACAHTEETIALFARMEVVLSMRLHALIFAAGQGVPLVGAVYDPKVGSFLDELDQDLYVPFEQVEAEKLNELLRAAAARVGDRDALERKAAKLIRLEANNSAVARKLLSK